MPMSNVCDMRKSSCPTSMIGDKRMGASPVLPVWDTFILTIPFLGILGMAMFGLDERLATPKSRSGPRRFFCEVERKGGPFACDPDGNPWKAGGVVQIEGRFTHKESRRAEGGVAEGRRHSAAHDENSQLYY
jgi:hypothetical protein